MPELKKIPLAKPGSNTFMVFSMLLLGVLAAAAVVMFDFWFGTERSLSSILIKRLHEANVPLIWVVSVSGLVTMAAGFFFYLCSYILLALPVFIFRKAVKWLCGQVTRLRSKGARSDCDPGPSDLFHHLSNEALKTVLPEQEARIQSIRFRTSFMYLLLTSVESNNAANVRFSFTQLMFARSVGGMIVLFTAYATWILGFDGREILLSAAIVNLLGCLLYRVGLIFFEGVMASGYLIDGKEALLGSKLEGKPKASGR